MKRSLLALTPLLAALTTMHCGGDDPAPAPAPAIDAGPDGAPQASGPGAPDAGREADPGPIPDPPLVPATKVDLLFVADNSIGMDAKHGYLADALGRVFGGLPVTDIHVGVISTSLGNGGNVCTSSNPRTDDHARLLNRSAGGAVVAGAERGFLALGAGGVTDVATLEARTKEILGGVGQSGCGFEAQLEAMYRFAVEPEPPAAVSLDPTMRAKLDGIDYELLAQRKAFFRPDSAVAIVMLTDEDDGSLDPLAIGGFGYAFGSTDFPGSSVRRGSSAQGTTAARGTSACASDPFGADCTSCGFATTCDAITPSCQKLQSDANCKESGDPSHQGPGYDGYYPAAADDLNVRLFDMRRRFGVEPRFPVTRYAIGLTGRRVPSRAAAHAETKDANGQRAIAEYAQATTCQNPLFASNLPEKAGDELCALDDNHRSSRLVTFGLIAGAPAELLKAPVDFTKLVGKNPPVDGSVSNDGALDPRMIQSVEPRAGVAGDWKTKGKDLQYACTFALPTSVDCAADERCDCFEPGVESPICSGTTQIRGKAYPAFRPLLLAQQLGERAVIASACELDAKNSYGAFFDALTVKLSGVIAK